MKINLVLVSTLYFIIGRRIFIIGEDVDRGRDFSVSGVTTNRGHTTATAKTV
jgi:hypothetical protein